MFRKTKGGILCVQFADTTFVRRGVLKMTVAALSTFATAALLISIPVRTTTLSTDASTVKTAFSRLDARRNKKADAFYQ